MSKKILKISSIVGLSLMAATAVIATPIAVLHSKNVSNTANTAKSVAPASNTNALTNHFDATNNTFVATDVDNNKIEIPNEPVKPIVPPTYPIEKEQAKEKFNIKTDYTQYKEPLLKLYGTASESFHDYVNDVDVVKGQEYRIDNTWGRYSSWVYEGVYPGWETQLVEKGVYTIKRGEQTHYLLDIGKVTTESLKTVQEKLKKYPTIDIVRGRIQSNDSIEWNLPSSIKKLELIISGNQYKALVGLSGLTNLQELELNAPELKEIIPSSLPLGVYSTKNVGTRPQIDSINLSGIENLTPERVSEEIYISHVLQADNWLFQGPLVGKGGYIANLNLENTKIKSLDGIILPTMSDGRAPFKWVGFGELPQELVLDLSKSDSSSEIANKIQDVWYGQGKEVEKLIVKGSTTVEVAAPKLAKFLRTYPIKNVDYSQLTFTDGKSVEELKAKIKEIQDSWKNHFGPSVSETVDPSTEANN